MNLEKILLDEWLYTALVVITLVWAFGLGMLVGWIWTLLL
jgi:hypothetical protein